MTLKQWLRQQKIKPGTFAGEIGISRQRIYTYFAGATPHLDIALLIVSRTAGAVTLRDLIAKKRH